MAYSDDYIRQLRKKDSKGMLKAGTIRNVLFTYLNTVPEDLKWDIYSLFFPDTDDDEDISTEKAEEAAAVIDLLEGEYDDDNIALTDEQLGYISEGINDYAIEISDEVLMNVMKAAVSRGLMG